MREQLVNEGEGVSDMGENCNGIETWVLRKTEENVLLRVSQCLGFAACEELRRLKSTNCSCRFNISQSKTMLCCISFSLAIVIDTTEY